MPRNRGYYESGAKSFGLGTGPGFMGGAIASIAEISMYHRYRMYQSLMMYLTIGGPDDYFYSNNTFEDYSTTSTNTKTMSDHLQEDQSECKISITYHSLVYLER